MSRVRAAALAGLAAGLAACAVAQEAPPSRSGPACVALFEQYDRIERYGPRINYNFRTDLNMLPAGLSRQTERLRRAGCFTRPEDLAGTLALGQRLAPDWRIVAGATPIRTVPMHAGVVAGIGDEIRATDFFRGLGYRVRTIGAPMMGRRVYVGPFRSEEALAQAMEVARQAGFIAPYPATQTRF